MIDSSVRNLGEAEYDKQNWLQHQKIQVRPLIVNYSCGQKFQCRALNVGPVREYSVSTRQNTRAKTTH